MCFSPLHRALTAFRLSLYALSCSWSSPRRMATFLLLASAFRKALDHTRVFVSPMGIAR